MLEFVSSKAVPGDSVDGRLLLQQAQRSRSGGGLAQPQLLCKAVRVRGLQPGHKTYVRSKKKIASVFSRKCVH